MKKEVIPTAPIPKPVTKTITKKQQKQTISKTVGSTIPTELIPTKKTNWIFGIIFILIIFIGIAQFPLGKLLQGNIDVKISFGIPWTFLEFDLENAETMPFKFGGLIGDMLIYVLIAYAIDVAINVFFKAMKSKSNVTPKKPKPQSLQPKQTPKQSIKKPSPQNLPKKMTREI
jgi:large-conductance mechanosensitive channel